MFCIKCGKKFEGEGYVCQDCLAAQEAAAPVIREPLPPPEAAPVAYTAPAAPAYQAPVYEQPAYQAPVYEQPVYQAPAYEPPVYQAPAQPAPGFTLSTAQDVPQKGKKKGLVVGLAVLAVLLIAGAVLLGLNWSRWFGKKDNLVVEVPEDPSEYIAFLHEPGMEELADDISEAYGNYLSGEGAAWDGELSLVLGDDLLSLLETALAEEGLSMDTAWLKNISLKAHYNAPDSSAMDMSLGLFVGKQEILSLDTAMDLKNMIIYMALPELSKDYVKMDMGAMLAQTGESFPMEEMLAISAQARQDMPSQEEVRGLLQGLQEILLSYMTDVQKSQELVSAGKAEQEVTALTVTLTEENLTRMLEDILAYIKQDQAARKIAQAYVNYTNAYGQLEGYSQGQPVSMEDFDAFIQEGLDTMSQLAQQAQPGNYLRLTTYANGADMLGCRFAVFTDGQSDGSMGYLTLEEKGNIYLEADMGQGTTLTGQGKRSGGKLTGEYVLVAQGVEQLTLKLKGVDTKTWYGTYEIIPGATLMEQMELEDALGVLASSFCVEVELGEGKLGAYLTVSGARFVGMELKLSQGEAEKVTLPKKAADALNEQELESWSQGLSLDQVLENLKKAGLPKDLYNMLKMLTYMT